jgi:hypothetical protein
MKKQIVNVTMNDIRKGHRNACSNCPIALALHRIKIFKNASVGSTFFGFWPKDSTNPLGESVQLPYEAQRFIQDFDYGTPVTPFKFKVEVPAHE